MAKTTKERTVSYFSLNTEVEGLNAAKAIKKVCTAIQEEARTWSPTAGSDHRQVLTSVSKKGKNGVCGTLVMYEKGRHQHLFVSPEEDHDGRVESAPVKKSEEGWPREVIEGALYFTAIDDHLAVVQSVSLKAKQLKEHLEWLFSEHLSSFPEGGTIFLKQELTQEAKTFLEKTPVNQIKISDDFKVVADKSSESEEKKGKKSSSEESYVLNPSWLKGLASKDEKVKDLFENVDPDDVSFDLLIRVKKRKAEDAQELVLKMATALGEENFEKVTFTNTKNQSHNGASLILKGKIKVDFYSGVISADSVYSAITEWLREKIKGGEIPV